MKRVSLFCVAVAILSLAAGSAFGSVDVTVGTYFDGYTPAGNENPPPLGDEINLSYSPWGASEHSGGPFLMTDLSPNGVAITGKGSGLLNQEQLVYCVEEPPANEVFSPGSNYYVYNTSQNTALATGNYATNVAKYIYYQAVRNGAAYAASFSSSLTSDDFQTAVQDAIWQGVLANGPTGSPLQINDLNSLAGKIYANAVFATGSVAGSLPTSGDGYWSLDVGVVNPVASDYNYSDPSNTQAQSQLYLTQAAGEASPEPAQPDRVVGAWCGRSGFGFPATPWCPLVGREPAGDPGSDREQAAWLKKLTDDYHHFERGFK